MFLRSLRLLQDKIPSRRAYPFSIPVIMSLEELEFTKPVTFFVGENGSGKSTLLEAIADKCEFSMAGGSVNTTYEVDAAQSALGEYVRLSWLPKVRNGFFLRAESFYHFATYLDELQKESVQNVYASYGGTSLHQQSHGESFLSLFQNRFGKKAIYLLDEPEAALSPARQLTFLRIMHELVRTGEVQFIIATHSPILLGYPDAVILSFDEESITEVAYETTPHYQITKYFLQHREKMLADLLRDEGECPE